MLGITEQFIESKSGRGDTIRTCDPLLPKQVLYQAELRPDPGFLCLYPPDRQVKTN